MHFPKPCAQHFVRSHKMGSVTTFFIYKWYPESFYRVFVVESSFYEINDLNMAQRRYTKNDKDGKRMNEDDTGFNKKS